jgi:uncharacterized coiled-coil protein SlyX
MSVTREEFDARVAAIEDRSAAQFGHIFVELHNINEKLDRHSDRFDNVDRKLDQIIEGLS